MLEAIPPEVEQRQRREYLRHRRLASGLLLVAAALFVVAHLLPAPGFWGGLLKAGSEAALVGGLADWFAVTALFRHPFGLPIPHTAIIARNKDRIGQNLGLFVARHFLSPDVLGAKLRSVDIAGRLTEWLCREGNAERLAQRTIALVPFLFNAVPDRELRRFVRDVLKQQVEQINLAPVFGTLLKVLREGRHHQLLFDRALSVGYRLLLKYQDSIFERVAAKSSWWIPGTVDRAIAERLVLGIADLLDELSHHDHEARHGLDKAVDDLIDRLLHSADYAATIESIKREVLANESVQGYLAGVWDALRELLVKDAMVDDSRLRKATAATLHSLGLALQRNPEVRAHLNARLERLAIEGVVPWRAEIGRFIEEVVRGWDAETVTERVELAVGRDLQFIRMNGTLVGALVGCLLYLLGLLWA